MLVRYEQVGKLDVKAGKQVRKIVIDTGLHGLADSLVKEGQLQPIGLLSDFSMIWGFRRHAAALLREEITHLWAAVFDQKIEEAEFLKYRAIENFQKLDLTAYEKFLTVEELQRHHPDWSNKQLADCLHVDPSMITYLLSPGRCISAIREALQAGAIGISDCYAMSRVDEKSQHELLAAKSGGASRDQVHRQARKARNGDVPTGRVNRIKCAMPGGRAIAITGQDITLDDAIDSTLEWIKFAKKAVERGWDVKTLERACAAEAKAGGGA